MHRFPPSAELQFLVGLDIGQIRLDPRGVQLHFSNGGHIAIEGEFSHVDQNGGLHVHHSGGERDVGPVFLRELIQEPIAVVTSEPLQLMLTFSNGAMLKILTDEGPYECGQIHAPGRPEKLIVF